MNNIDTSSLPPWLKNPDPNIYLSNNYCVVDLEYDPQELILACWSLGKDHPKHSSQIKSKFGGIYEQNELLEDIKLAKFLVCHFAKGAELPWLSKCGLKLEEVLCYDTMLGEYCILGNRKAEFSLDAISKRYNLGGKESWVSIMIAGGIPPSQIPALHLGNYCSKDVRLTEGVFLKQRQLLLQTGLLPVCLTRNIVSPVLVEIEQNGLYTPGISSIQLDKIHQEFSTLQTSLNNLTGGINQNSPKQIAAYLYDTLKFEELKDHKGKPIRTPKDGRKTGTDVITALKAKTEEQEQFKYLISSIINIEDERDFLLKLDGSSKNNNGIVLAKINQTVTQTHRLSSTGVPPYIIQFHNIARARKKYFGPRFGTEEWEMFSPDGSQLEFRVGAHMGRCEKALEFIRQGKDIHIESSKAIGVPRQQAKEFSFGPLYGKQSGPPPVKKWIKTFKELFPGISETQKGWTYEVLKTKKLQIETGLIFYWPDCELTHSGYITNTTNIFNYPIQSMATADIIPICLSYMWHLVKRICPKEGFIVNTVHDSLDWEIKKKSRELFLELSCLSMSTLVYDYLYKVYGITFLAPLGVGCKAGPEWGGGDEINLDIDIEGKRIIRKGEWTKFVDSHKMHL